jgi:outer membrane protein OmpA-like peptidoglycan-associated protein
MLSGQGDVEKLPAYINTADFDETTPVISKSGNKLFFTRTADPGFEGSLLNEEGLVNTDKQDATYQNRLALIYSQLAGKTVTNPETSIFNQDIWYAPVDGEEIGEALHPGYPLNNALPNSLVSVGVSNEEYVILNQFYDDGSMHAGFSRISMSEDGTYQAPLPMNIYEFNLSSSDVDLTMTPDGQVLVMSMQRKDGKGMSDMYVSFYLRYNLWSAPMHMGNVLNTNFQESSPHITSDKRYLYFASGRPGGAGGLDIYVSERLDYSWMKWSEPVLVDGEVNTVYDESQPYFDPDANWLYFNSRRDGSSDIYRQRLHPKPKLKKPLFVRGKIVDASTGQPVHSELFWGQHSANEYLEYFNTYTGEFEISLTEAEPYKFQPRKANHNAQRILIDPRGMESQGIDTLDLVLYVEPKKSKDQPEPEPEKRKDIPEKKGDTITENTKLTFYDINFIRGRDIILTKSKPALKYIYQMMVDHPTLEILIEGHTDNVGDEASLVDLSVKRAAAIRNYLLHEGISINRMKIAGKGCTEAIYGNASETSRAKNRRVEITVTKY